MKFTADDFRHLYADMPDEELRSLVREDLSEVARPVYDAELAKRGFQARPVARAVDHAPRMDTPDFVRPAAIPLEPLGEEEVEREEEEDLAPAAVFTTRAEAMVARAVLQTGSIPAFVENDSAAGGGYRLLVAESYAGEARERLERSPND